MVSFCDFQPFTYLWIAIFNSIELKIRFQFIQMDFGL